PRRGARCRFVPGVRFRSLCDRRVARDGAAVRAEGPRAAKLTHGTESREQGRPSLSGLSCQAPKRSLHLTRPRSLFPVAQFLSLRPVVIRAGLLNLVVRPASADVRADPANQSGKESERCTE